MLSSISCANSQTANSFMPSMTHSNSIVGRSDTINLNSEPSTNSNSLDVYNSPFSPDDSSYSENSDYTSDEYDSDYMNTDNNNYNKYPQQNLMLSTSTSASSNSISSSSASLPPFPTISTNSGVNATNAVNIHNNSFLTFTQNGHHFNTNQLALHQSTASSFSTQYVIHPQLYNYSELYQRHYILSNASTSSSQNCLVNSSSNLMNNTQQTNCIISVNNSNEDEQQYTDLSLSIASSSAVESLNGLLSAANSSKDNRVTPVSLINDSLRESPTNELILCKENGESQESSSFVSSDSSETDHNLNESNEQQLLKSDEMVGDNFGEIIKKTIVETVSA